MKILFIITFIFFSHESLCQKREIVVENYAHEDSSIYFKSMKKVCEQTDLELIKNTEKKYFFRFWTSSQAIEISKDLNGEYAGKVMCWITENNDDERLEKLIYFEHLQLDSITVAQIKLLIDTSKINYIPDMSYINNWKNGICGYVDFIEFANEAKYFFKTYSNSDSKKGVLEAVVVKNFKDKLFQLVVMKKIWDNFMKRVPFARMLIEHRGMSRILTKKEHQDYKKRRKAFIKSRKKIKKQITHGS